MSRNHSPRALSPLRDLLAHPHFANSTAQRLYAHLHHLPNSLTASQAEAQRDALLASRLPTHLPTRPRSNLLDNCFLQRGIGLKRGGKLPSKQRSFTVIKANIRRQDTITEQEFRRRISTQQQEEIVYQYDLPPQQEQPLPALPTETIVQSQYIPASHSSSKQDLKTAGPSRLSTHPPHDHDSPTQPYDFSRFQKTAKLKVTQAPKANLFNWLDRGDCSCWENNEWVARKIQPASWQAQTSRK